MEVNRTALGFRALAYTDRGDEICAEVTKIVEKEEHLYGLLELRCKPAHTYRRKKLYFGTVNLTGSRARKDLANYLKNLEPEIDWDSVIEKAFQRIIEEYYTPELPTKAKIVETTSISFLLEPFLIRGHPTLVYAAGGTGKSLLAQFVCLLLQNGLTLTLQPGEKCNCLYLDWELDENEFNRRLSMLVPNLPEGEIDTPFYKKCALPLRDEMPTILRAVTENDIGFVVIDSAGPSIGGDINEAAKVIEFFNCVRKLTVLGVTVLILSHVSKQAKRQSDGSPIGSVYFENLSRVCWELRQRNEDHSIQLALVCRKSNFGPLKPLGFEIVFEDGLAFIQPMTPEEAEDVAKSRASELILAVLDSVGEADVAELAKKTGIEIDYLRQVLHRLHKRGLVVNTSRGKWKRVVSEE